MKVKKQLFFQGPHSPQRTPPPVAPLSPSDSEGDQMDDTQEVSVGKQLQDREQQGSSDGSKSLDSKCTSRASRASQGSRSSQASSKKDVSDESETNNQSIGLDIGILTM